ncbi:MAG: ABC transporter permease subunit [Actinomycetota bacterium]|nr:ABC transporter permease subunit [Actinomycetota bacterium]
MSVTPRQRSRRRLTGFRVVVFALLGLFFVVPLLSMLDFSTRTLGGGRDLDAWKALGQDAQLRGAIITSLELSVLTVLAMLILLVPTMVWVRLRVPGATRAIEFLCLLPLTIPALVLVVGLRPVFAWITYFFGDTALTLAFAYTVLVLPYAYRSIDAGLASIDVKTLSEAARSLGASWYTVMTRVIVPNIGSALLSAAFISVALVLGEFTIASLLNYDNLQVVINLFGKSSGKVSVAASLASLIFAFVLLVLLSFVGRRSKKTDKTTTTDPQPLNLPMNG